MKLVCDFPMMVQAHDHDVVRAVQTVVTRIRFACPRAVLKIAFDDPVMAQEHSEESPVSMRSSDSCDAHSLSAYTRSGRFRLPDHGVCARTRFRTSCADNHPRIYFVCTHAVLKIVFGFPMMAHEDDPVRAVHAAIEIRKNLKSFNVQSCLGIATGTTICGDCHPPSFPPV